MCVRVCVCGGGLVLSFCFLFTLFVNMDLYILFTYVQLVVLLVHGRASSEEWEFLKVKRKLLVDL